MPASAAAKLQPSRLSDQLEALGDDLDLDEVNLAVRGRASFAIGESIVDGQLERTIEGPSTLTLTVKDHDRTLLQSGVLEHTPDGVDTKLDGLWFRLAGIEKRGDELVLTFIDREVAVLKKYPLRSKPKTWWRSWPTDNVTRTQFARALVTEVGELSIRFEATESKNPADAITTTAARKTPTEKHHAREPGFAKGAVVTVQHHPATKEQRDNIARVLDVGVSMGLQPTIPQIDRLILIASMMVITQESNALTSATNGVHVGLFQQDPAYWPATRLPEPDAHEFFVRAISYMKSHPNIGPGDLALALQNPGGTTAQYGQWRTEAAETVDAYFGIEPGSPAANDIDQEPSATEGNLGFFVRGVIKTVNGRKKRVRESNWACLQRIADERGWRAFCVSGTVYFKSEQDLFRSAPRMTISEDEDGVDWVDGTLDDRLKHATVTVQCRLGRWEAPPGSVVVVEDTGPLNGRWLVTTISRSLFAPDGTITLAKPQPQVPETQTPEFASATAGMTGVSKVSTSLEPSGGGSSSVAEFNVPGKVATHGAQVPRRITIHDAESDGDPAGLATFWQNDGRGFGAHAAIGSDGSIVHFAPDRSVTWHTGGANQDNLGVELMGFARFDTGTWLARTAQLNSLCHLIASWSKTWSIPLVKSTEHGVSTHAMQSELHPESDGHYDPGPGFPFEAVLARARDLAGL